MAPAVGTAEYAEENGNNNKRHFQPQMDTDEHGFYRRKQRNGLWRDPEPPRKRGG